jgi:hypothetical protein
MVAFTRSGARNTSEIVMFTFELLGDRDKGHVVLIEQLHELGEVCQRPGQAVDLIDDDDFDLPAANIPQQSL